MKLGKNTKLNLRTEYLQNNSVQLLNFGRNKKAYDFKVKTLDRAKALIGDILSVTTGSSVAAETNSEWGHDHFLERV